MARAFTTRISNVRLTLSPLSSQQMADIGQVMVDQKISRIKRGLNSSDMPAKPLVPRYADRKLKRNRAPIRDWSWSGQMLGSFKVKRANQDRVTIGFVNPRADDKATIQRRYEEMLSDSPRDEEVLRSVVRASFKQKSVVRVVKNVA